MQVGGWWGYVLLWGRQRIRLGWGSESMLSMPGGWDNVWEAVRAGGSAALKQCWACNYV